MSLTAVIRITSCKTCPKLHARTVYTGDSYERGEDWYCLASNNRLIAGFVEWRDKPEIPEWCPNLEDSKENKEALLKQKNAALLRELELIRERILTIDKLGGTPNEELMNEFRRLSAKCKELTNVESKEKVP